jgi:hypothetical protein
LAAKAACDFKIFFELCAGILQAAGVTDDFTEILAFVRLTLNQLPDEDTYFSLGGLSPDIDEFFSEQRIVF